LERIQIYFPAQTRRGQAGDGSQGSPGLPTEAVLSSVEEQACQQQRAADQEPGCQIWDAELDQFLTQTGGEIEWNFTKCLVERDGEVVAPFPSKVTPDSLEVNATIETVLAQ
jgi:glutathione peroxidase-family protein